MNPWLKQSLSKGWKVHVMFHMTISLWNDYSLLLFSQMLVYNMEDNEQSGAAPRSEEIPNNNMELNDQLDTDGESGPCETITSCAQCICGMTLKIAVKIAIIFGIVALGSVITGVTVSTQHKSHSNHGRHEFVFIHTESERRQRNWECFWEWYSCTINTTGNRILWYWWHSCTVF